MKSKAEIIAQFVRGKVLDIGYAQEPNPYLNNVYGVDILVNPQSNYIETKKANLNSDRIPYPDGFFDSVAMGCVLAHVYNPFALLSEVNRVLIEDGVLVISSPNPHYYWEVIINIFFHFFKRRVSKAKCDEHFYSFSRFDMRTLLARAGFEVESEVGHMFAIVKTPFRFNVPAPFAYEIVYIARRVREPKDYITSSVTNTGHIQKIEKKVLNLEV